MGLLVFQFATGRLPPGSIGSDGRINALRDNGHISTRWPLESQRRMRVRPTLQSRCAATALGIGSLGAKRSVDLERLTPYIKELTRKQHVTAQSLEKIEDGDLAYPSYLVTPPHNSLQPPTPSWSEAPSTNYHRTAWMTSLPSLCPVSVTEPVGTKQAEEMTMPKDSMRSR